MQPDSIEPRTRIPIWRYIGAWLAPAIFGWLVQALIVASLIWVFTLRPEGNLYTGIPLFILYPIGSYAGLSFFAGLIYSLFWLDASRPRRNLQLEMLFLWALVLFPTLYFFSRFSLLIYSPTFFIGLAGLNWGLNNWPKKPWEVWLGQRIPEVPTPRRLD